MKNALILVASSNPILWQTAKEALAPNYAVAFSLDIAGTLEVLRKHRPLALLLCSQLLDRCRADALSQLADECQEGIQVIVLSASGKAAEPQRSLPLRPSAWLAQSLVTSSLAPLVRNLLGRRSGGRLASSPQQRAAPSADASAGGTAPRENASVQGPVAVPGLQAAVAPKPPEEAIESPVYRSMVVGRSAGMKRLLEIVRRVAATDATVLVSGESGVGKEVLARWIHCTSSRRRGPFKTADLPAIPDELFESILFGHEKGAFTGAEARNQGKFQRATHGTLFLDEISSLKLTLQPKLLRAIQEKQVEAVGGGEPTVCDVRIIAATNVDLAAAVRRGEFRKDLYHRLNVFALEIPPLRERREDLEDLCALFLARYAAVGREPPRISPEGMAALRSYDWPGNVRELENLIQRAVLLASGPVLGPEELMADRDRADLGAGGELCFASCELPLDQLEQLYIKHVLDRCRGNQSRAAQLLSIDRKTLRAKLLRACEPSEVTALER